ncbi:MAG: hypothetical protein JWO83_2439 [Caulobacteraceae bacterium]|nr:hypothetical protein [Caulobacteraceae bacterium]
MPSTPLRLVASTDAPPAAVPPALSGSAAAAAAAAASLAAKTHPALAHAVKAGTLQTDRAARALGDARATAEVFAGGVDPADWQELLQMQDAAWRRLYALQDGWLKGWAQWMQYAGQIRGANTLSKLVERESNIGVQFSQLLSAQFTDLVGLQENIEVGYSYWINGRLAEKRRSPATWPAPSPPS